MNKDVKFRSILEGDDPLGRYLLGRIVRSELEQFLKNFDKESHYRKSITWKKLSLGGVLTKIDFIYDLPKETP